MAKNGEDFEPDLDDADDDDEEDDVGEGGAASGGGKKKKLEGGRQRLTQERIVSEEVTKYAVLLASLATCYVY